ncbi:oxidoreductase [Meredithblackwellia eburnea MCA 4105]
MDYSEYKDAVAFVTGAASGIGFGCAKAFVANGVRNLVMVDLFQENLDKAAGELKAAAKFSSEVKILTVPTNVSVEAEVDAAVAKTIETFGRIDFCLNAAGVNMNPRGFTETTSMDLYDRIMGINLRGVFMCQRAQIRAMLKQEPRSTRACDKGLRGAIVHIGSNSAFAPPPNLTPYAASKAGVSMLVHADGKAYAEHGIRLNAIAPGIIATAMNLSSRQAGETFDEMVQRTPAKRIGEAEEIANAALFLAHPLSTFINGQTLIVDGGYSLG